MNRKRMFQHAAARRRLVRGIGGSRINRRVSTRSRPKAAGLVPWLHRSQPSGFNTQPPEGGWGQLRLHSHCSSKFQHAAARRRLAVRLDWLADKHNVSTRSRPKAAGPSATVRTSRLLMFQHAAARRRLDLHCSKSLIRHGFQHAAARRRLVKTVGISLPIL